MTIATDSTGVGASPSSTPLTGFTVGITAARRSDEFATLLERRGAKVRLAPAIRIIPLANDEELLAATQELIAHPPEVVVATTGIGFRGWFEAAEGWGLAEDLIKVLEDVSVLARGPKAKGAIRAAGLREEWSPPNESSSEVIDHLLAQGVADRRIAVQLHGATTEWEPLPDFSDVLRHAGASVIPIPVYRWLPPIDLSNLDKLIRSTVSGEIDALSFTSAPAVASILGRAKELGLLDDFVEALRTAVLPVCVGPVTAGPLDALKVPSTQPQRARLGALARHIAEELPRRNRSLRAGGHEVAIRGSSVLVDGVLRTVSPAGMALLRTLAKSPGRVVKREVLLDVLPGGGGDTHAVETAMARLRTALGSPKVIQTVVKRGYRLAVDFADDFPELDPPTGGGC